MVAAWRATVNSTAVHTGCMVGLLLGGYKRKRRGPSEKHKHVGLHFGLRDYVRALTYAAVLRRPICHRRNCHIAASYSIDIRVIILL